jgi:hypothetical protein
MSGLNISCGEFRADEKSGSSFERVLFELTAISDGTQREILAGFDEAEFTQIATDVAIRLIPHLRDYRDARVLEIGHCDFLTEMDREERSGASSVKLKWGEGRGWRLYCAINLLAACEHLERSHEPVIVCIDQFELDFTRFRRHKSTSSSKLLECQRAQLV